MKKQKKKPDTKQKKSKSSKRYNKYSYSLKRRIVNDILRGIISKEEALLKYGIKSRQSINYWLRKYSLLNYRSEKDYGMKESPSEEIKRLKLRNSELEASLIVLNTAIDLADEELETNIRKKYLPQPLKGFKKHLSTKK